MNRFLRAVEQRIARERALRVEAFEDPTHYARGLACDQGSDAAMSRAERAEARKARGRRVAYQTCEGESIETAAAALGITPREAAYALRAARSSNER